jgi:alanine dehydrogenase
LIPGHSAPKLISRAMLEEMKQGAVVVDVAVDQGGCLETTRPTTHSDPVYEVMGVVHYCVANMPGAVPRTSTFALNNATFPYAMALAQKGVARAIVDDPGLRSGVNTYAGKLTHEAVAESQDRAYTDLAELL